MLQHRFFVSFISTMLLYVLLGTLFFYLQQLSAKPIIKKKIITLSLSSYVPEALPPKPIKEKKEPLPPIELEPIVEEVKEPEVPVATKVPPLPEPIVETIVLKPTPKKVVQKKKKRVKKKIRKKKVKKSKRVKSKQKTKTVKKRRLKTHHKRTKKSVHKTTKKVSKHRKTKPRKKKPRKKKQKKHSALDKQKFKNALHNTINKHKSYPRIAERRGIRGTVHVRFYILANGHISNLKLTGKKIFYKSTRKAIHSAFPLNPKKVPFSLPQSMSFNLNYR